jgi:SNF2 family DNA or RNA helicase
VNVRQIAERIAKEYGPDSVVTYFGETSTDDRRAAIRTFQDLDSPVRFFVSNKTGAKGITLTASHTAIYYSYDHDLETHEQGKDRIHRIGQHWPCSYVYQRVPGTVDDKILDALVGKLDISKQITASNWREYMQ